MGEGRLGPVNLKTQRKRELDVERFSTFQHANVRNADSKLLKYLVSAVDSGMSY